MGYSALLGALCCIRRMSQPLERFSLGSGDGQELNLASVCTVLTLHHIPAVRTEVVGFMNSVANVRKHELPGSHGFADFCADQPTSIGALMMPYVV